MKLKDLVKDRSSRLKVIITESQFKRLTNNLINEEENKLKKDLKTKNNGRKK